MPKFILIDNSISDTAGHHYQYAAFCLKAATDLGYESILATNKKNKETENLPWKVYPVYTGTFWDHEEYHSFLISLYNKFENNKHKIVRSGILRIIGTRLAKKLLNKNKIKEFAKNTEDLFKKISIAEGDIVFLPTSGLVEMFGISESAKKNSSLKKISWHFLFRRNIYTGSPENYSFMYIKLRLLKIVFDNFLKNGKIQTFFYTDSEQLTDQYDRINSVKFQTLPIPHTLPKSKSKKQNDKLIITYLGDARTEKGYQYLTSTIQDLWLEYVKNDKVSFIIQSNYNIPEGEPAAVVSRNQLQNFPSDKVKLILNPPDLNEYQKLLQNSDVILLPYDKTNYYARSSGILAEALAYGIPVVVPSGTWLSRQFTNDVYKYHLSLREKLTIVKSYTLSTLNIIYDKNAETIFSTDGKISLDWTNPQAHCWLKVPPFALFMLVKVSFSKDNTSSAVVLYCSQLTQDKLSIKETSHFIERSELPFATIVLPIEKNVQKIWLGIKHTYTNVHVVLSEVNVDFLTTDKPQKNIPISSVGIIYENPEQISVMLSNLIDNYDHYVNTAQNFSNAYYEKHNANELVKKITHRTTNKNTSKDKSVMPS